jgi:hypothetical protein
MYTEGKAEQESDNEKTSYIRWFGSGLEEEEINE